MTARQSRPLPKTWLVTDARNWDAVPAALARLPRGSGVIARLGHLPESERRVAFARLAPQARARGHRIVLAGDMALAKRWGADGAYGFAARVARGGEGLRLVTAHSLTEIAKAVRARADAVVLSPVYPTRSHPGGKTLGPVRWRLLAARSPRPCIALGGMTASRARRLGSAFAAIDGLS